MNYSSTRGGGGELLPSNGLLGMYRWMGWYFHDSTDYNGVTISSIFNSVTRMGVARVQDFTKIICPKVSKMGFIIGHKIDIKHTIILKSD